ncbi:MAG: hypothetical protein ACREHD_08270 [Pirellulales bacterium]
MSLPKTQCGSKRYELLYGERPGIRHGEISARLLVARRDFWDDGR